jgi:hypothetical protein
MTKKVTLEDGRTVSRQYAHYLKSKKAKQLHKDAMKKYKSKDGVRLKYKANLDEFKKKFLEENDVSYDNWYYHNVLKLKNKGKTDGQDKTQ